MSDLNSIAVSERTSLNVYDADIFNCSRQQRDYGIAARPSDRLGYRSF